ncbi:MAG: hypothetical protein LBF97_03030 [Elusimicrobiota bacterium]|jgi:hypothetical protein|nr:hypothetical protein [Elusimicrobiota bacterium]
MNKKLISIILLIVFLVLGIFFLSKNFNIRKKNIKIENIIKLPSGFNPIFRISEKEYFKNVSNPEFRMILYKIILPENLSPSLIENNLKSATIQAYNDNNKPYRITIAAYRENDNLNGLYTIAESNFFPDPQLKKEEVKLKDYVFKLDYKG